MRRRALCLLLTSLLACVSAPEPHVDTVEIRVPGEPEGVDLDTVKDGLANHPPSGIIFRDVATFERLALRFDRLRIETYFRRHGYYEAKVTDVTVEESEDGSEVRIAFEVEPGPKSELVDIAIHGAPDVELVDEKSLELCSLLERGKRVSYEEFVAAEKRIRDRLANRGYAHVEVDPRLEVESDSGRAVAHYLIEPGPLTYFGKVFTSTPSALPSDFILNRVSWERGDVFDPHELEQTRGRLLRSGLVADVRFVQEGDPTSEIVDVEIKAATGKPREFRIGAGVGIQQSFYEVRGRIGYRQKQFFDPLTTIDLEFRPAYAIFQNADQAGGFNWEARATLSREDFLFPRVRGSAGVEFESIQLDVYTTIGPSASVALGRYFADDRLNVSLALYAYHKWFSGVVIALPEEELRDVGLVDPLFVTYTAPTITYDGRDDPLVPTRGFFTQLRAELGYVLTGERSVYLEILPEVRGYVPLGDRVVIASRVSVGFGALGLRPIPIPQRFFGGGADSHRGFGRRRLSPRAPATTGGVVPVGGEAELLASVEARVDLFEVFGQLLGAVAFVDAGDVVLDLGDLDLANLHYAVGPGLRLHTPVGVVRADVGFRVNRTAADDPDPDSPFAFHLSLGEAF